MLTEWHAPFVVHRAHEPCKDVQEAHVALFHTELLKLAEEELEKKERKRLRSEKDFKRLVKKYVDRGKLLVTGAGAKEGATRPLARAHRLCWATWPAVSGPGLFLTWRVIN